MSLLRWKPSCLSAFTAIAIAAAGCAEKRSEVGADKGTAKRLQQPRPAPASTGPALPIDWPQAEQLLPKTVMPATPVAWPVLQPEAEGFRVELPGVPDPQSSEVDTPAGKVSMRLYSLADDGRKRLYSVALNRLPVKPDAAEAESFLDRSRDGAVKLVAGKIKRETKERYGRHPGRSLLVELPRNVFVHARLIVADDRLYQVSIVSDSEQLTADDRRVFDSLTIDPTGAADARPQFSWRYVTPQGSTFAVEMPGDPREQVGTLNTPLGRVDLRRLEVSAGSRTYFAQSCDLPGVGAAAAVARLDAARDHVVRETGGKLVEERPVTLSGSEGRTIAVRFNGRTMLVQTFIDGPRIYQVGVVGPGEATDDDRRFFASLRLSELSNPK